MSFNLSAPLWFLKPSFESKSKEPSITRHTWADINLRKQVMQNKHE
jgi:hypothetical protein